MEVIREAPAIIAGFLLVAGLWFWIGYSTGRDATQREAATSGVAEWVVGKDGEAEFRWKVPAIGDK